MINDNKINSFGLFAMIISLTSSSFYGIYSAYIIYLSKTMSLISMLIGLLFGLVFSNMFLKLFKSKSNLSMTNKIKLLFPKLSIFINIILIICTLLTYIFLTYRLTSFLSNEYLINMPTYLISLLIIIVTTYIASKGLDTTIKVTTITFYISIIVFLFDSLSLFPQVKIDNFLPIYNVNKTNVIISSLYFTLYFFVPIVNIGFIKYNYIVDNNKFTKYYYLSIILSFIMSFILLFNTIGVSGIKVCSLFDYPIYTTLKRIKLFNFLDSLENISISLWIFYVINSSSLIILSLFNQIKDTFNLTNKKTIIINSILIVISFILPNIIFNNSNYIETFNYIYIPLIVLLIYFITIVTLFYKNKR